CGTLGPVPDTYTGVFDGFGSFLQPNNITMNLQLSYDVSPRVNVTGVLANIFNTCWGGSTMPWTFTDHDVCAYVNGGSPGAGIAPIGNEYNPAGHDGSIIQPFVKYPYGPNFGVYNQDGNATKAPFNFYVTAKIKI
ncbi:MAG: hypothetical protein JO192_06530, partial [Candidatus Eremiobacteraeota bacterium]|nr:hypothetical protein [Candidatus Eremiobacteraeota bacterium]